MPWPRSERWARVDSGTDQFRLGEPVAVSDLAHPRIAFPTACGRSGRISAGTPPAVTHNKLVKLFVNLEVMPCPEGVVRPWRRFRSGDGAVRADRPGRGRPGGLPYRCGAATRARRRRAPGRPGRGR